MGIRAFISATKEDLEADCRPRAIQAVEMCQAAAVTMETWDADYLDPITLCRQKIDQESSHYLGIFSYRYGWAPPVLAGKSITQAEFEWAQEFRKPMVIFVPDPTSDFAAELRMRAEGQEDAERACQEAFLKTIGQSGTYQPFEDVFDLVIRVTRKVQIWNGGGLRAIAEEAVAPAAQAQPIVRPCEDDILQLGHDDQFQAFKKTLGLLVNPALANRACFLLHGPAAFGQRTLSARLRKYVEDSSRAPEVHATVSIGPLWRQNSLAQLLRLLGRELDPEWEPESPGALALRLADVLDVNDVIFEIADAQRFDGGVPGFIDNFWKPMIGALPARTKNRLVALLDLEKDIPPNWEPGLQAPPEIADTFDPEKAVRLPVLDIFTQDELASWLQKWFDAADAWELAGTLIDETQGMPQALYNKLRDDATWMT